MLNGTRQSTDHGRLAVDPREHLKLQMRRNGLSASELAKEFGLHSQTIYNVTSGTRRISSKLALKLTERFGESVDFWLGHRILPRSTLTADAPRASSLAPEAVADSHLRNFPPGILVDTELSDLVYRNGSGLVIRPFDEANVSPASYDLTVGLIVTEGFSTLDKYGWGLIVKYVFDDESLRADEREEAVALIDEYENDIAYETSLTLGIGIEDRRAVGIVLREELKFSSDFIARAGGTTKNAVRGLMIGHGLQVDPGYSGPILITALNIGLEPIALQAGQKILSLEVIRLGHTPKVPYHEGTNSKIARIIERLSVEIADIFDYDAIPNENRYNVVLQANPDETFVYDGTLEDVRNHVVTRVVESLALGDSVHPFILPFTRALGQVTIEESDAAALIQRFPACTEEARLSAKAAFNNGRYRKTLKETLKKLDLEPGPAVAKLMGIKAG